MENLKWTSIIFYNPFKDDTAWASHTAAQIALKEAADENERILRSFLKPLSPDLEHFIMIQRSLAEGRLPLAACYWPERGEADYQSLMLEKGYYVKEAEYSHIDNNLSAWQRDFEGARVFEFCAGDCIRVRKTLSKVRRRNWPAHIILCDSIGVNELMKHAGREITGKANYSNDDISYAAGNIFDEAFWQELKALYDRLPETNKPDVVLLRGATLNNFSEEQLLWLLKKMSEFFPPGTIFRFGVDCTLHMPTLRGAYLTRRFLRWEKRGAIFVLNKYMPGEFEEKNIVPYVDFHGAKDYERLYLQRKHTKEENKMDDEYVKIIGGIEFHPEQEIPYEKYRLSFRNINFDEITKFSEKRFERYFRESKMMITNIERSNMPKFPNANSNTFCTTNLTAALNLSRVSQHFV